MEIPSTVEGRLHHLQFYSPFFQNFLVIINFIRTIAVEIPCLESVGIVSVYYKLHLLIVKKVLKFCGE